MTNNNESRTTEFEKKKAVKQAAANMCVKGECVEKERENTFNWPKIRKERV